jgi:PAS domain S-box-containing protein
MNEENISNNKWTMQQLHEAQNYAENIVSTIREPLLVLDSNLRIISANPSFYRVFSTTSDETQGKLIYEVGNGEWNIPALRDLLENILPKNTSFENYEVDHEFTNLGRRIMLLNARRIHDEGSQTQKILLAIDDVTERKQAEEKINILNASLVQRATELEAANKELESFSYSVSHDLRAPLRSIDGFSQAVIEDYSGKLDPDGLEYLERIRASSQDMTQLIDDILDLSRITRTEIHLSKVNLSKLAQEVTIELKRLYPDRHVDFIITSGLEAYGDSHLLKLVFDNLLDNAFKFTGKRALGKVEFGAIQYNGEQAYFVRDNGAGFDMAHVDNLFKPFQRLHSKEEFPGTGIGLASVLNIVRRLGGKVWAEGQEDKGATFYFTLQQISPV